MAAAAPQTTPFSAPGDLFRCKSYVNTTFFSKTFLLLYILTYSCPAGAKYKYQKYQNTDVKNTILRYSAIFFSSFRPFFTSDALNALREITLRFSGKIVPNFAPNGFAPFYFNFLEKSAKLLRIFKVS